MIPATYHSRQKNVITVAVLCHDTRFTKLNVLVVSQEKSFLTDCKSQETHQYGVKISLLNKMFDDTGTCLCNLCICANICYVLITKTNILFKVCMVYTLICPLYIDDIMYQNDEIVL